MYRIPESIRSTHGEDGAVVLDIRQGQMFNLNVMGSRVLRLIEAGSPQPVIVEQIVQEFGVSRHLVEHDVQDFLETLRKYRLIESADSP